MELNHDIVLACLLAARPDFANATVRSRTSRSTRPSDLLQHAIVCSKQSNACYPLDVTTH